MQYIAYIQNIHYGHKLYRIQLKVYIQNIHYIHETIQNTVYSLHTVYTLHTCNYTEYSIVYI